MTPAHIWIHVYSLHPCVCYIVCFTNAGIPARTSTFYFRSKNDNKTATRLLAILRGLYCIITYFKIYQKLIFNQLMSVEGYFGIFFIILVFMHIHIPILINAVFYKLDNWIMTFFINLS